MLGCYRKCRVLLDACMCDNIKRVLTPSVATAQVASLPKASLRG